MIRRPPSPLPGRHRTRVAAALASTLIASTASANVSIPQDESPSDRFRVRMPRSAEVDSAREGTLLLLLVPATRREAEQPADGPWWAKPHPFAATSLKPSAGSVFEFAIAAAAPGPAETALPLIAASGDAPVLEPGAMPPIRWFPSDPSSLAGAFRAQAVFRPGDADPTPGGAGEWRSRVLPIELAPDRADEFELELEIAATPSALLPPSSVIGPGEPPPWILVEERSRMLERAGAERPIHRAWVVFPRDYHDLAAKRRLWPAIYVIPHDGDGRREAEALRESIAIPETRRAMPQAVWIVLDPSSRWGHHGFADSPVHGPRAAALVAEFIPALERRLRLVDRGSARLLSGHGAGGWSAIWLQNEHPRDFGGAFATSPETVDLSRIGTVDAYGRDAFTDANGLPRPAYREAVAGRGEAIRATIEQEWRMADAASPEGRSGNRWHRWAARLSPLDETGRPRGLFDDEGRVDRGLAERWWLRQDLAAALAREPLRRVRIWDESIQVRVGSLDEHFHDRTLLSLRAYLSDLRRELGLPRGRGGTIELIPGATFETIVPKALPDMHRGMVEKLRAAGHHD